MDWKKIVGQNWAFYSHQKLYDMVKTEATGAGAVSAADQAWARFAAMMNESVEDIQQALAEAGVHWEGLAAESMQSSVAPLAQWAQDAGTAGSASGGSVQEVGEAFSYAANAMPEPVKSTTVPGTFPWIFGGQIDQDRREREAQQAKQRAVELMEGYARNADSAVASVGTFVPPQSVAVRVPPRTFGPGPVRQDTASFPWPQPAPRKASAPDPGPPPSNPPQGGEPGPVPGGSPAPGPGGATPGPVDGGPATTPESTPSLPAAPLPGQAPHGPADGGGASGRPPVSGFDPITSLPIDPRTGRPADPISGRLGGTTPHPGGESGRGGRNLPGEDGRKIAGRGGLTGSAPIEAERALAGRGAGAGPRGAAGNPGMAPLGAGTPREEDEEHFSPEYLRDYHDQFWDDIPPVSPAVIGDDEPAEDGS
jgi:type II secretory pathway pseudopilin PulG